MLTKEALLWATSRIEDFYEVQKGQGHDQMMEALNILRESLGLDDDLLDTYRLWTEDFAGDEHLGAMILGFMVGLMVFEYERY